MTRPLTLVLALGWATGSAWAADLATVYHDAVAYDAQYAAALAEAEAGREAVPQARAGLLPNIGVSANRMHNDVTMRMDATSTTTGASYASSGWSVTLTQPLFRWDRWAGYQQANARVVQVEAKLGLAKQDLILRAAQAYFDVLQARVSLSAAEANKQAIAEQLEEAKRAFEVGTKTVVEVHDAQARYDLATAQEIVARNDLEVRRQQLRLVAGKDYDALKPLRAGVELPRPQPDDIAKWVESAQHGYLGVQMAEAEVLAREEEVSRQRAGHLPSVDLVASRGKSSQDANLALPGQSGNDNYNTTVGIQLTIPLFAGFGVNSAVDQAVALKKKSESDLENARRTAAFQAQQAYLGVSAGLSQVKALEAALVSSQSALDSNKLGFEVGVRTNIEVLNAQSQFYDTRQKLVKARLDTLLGLLKLKGAAGSLTEDDLTAVNALMD